jgi:hypothetical protein
VVAAWIGGPGHRPSPILGSRLDGGGFVVRGAAASG